MRNFLLLFAILVIPFSVATTIDVSDYRIQGPFNDFSVGPEGFAESLDLEFDSSGLSSVTATYDTDLVVITSDERTHVWDLRKSSVCEVSKCPYMSAESLNQVNVFYDSTSRDMFVRFAGPLPQENTQVVIAGKIVTEIQSYEFFGRQAAWGINIETDRYLSCDQDIAGVVYSSDSSVKPQSFRVPITCVNIEGSCGDNVCNAIESFRYCDADCMEKTNRDFSVSNGQLQGEMTGNGVCNFEFRQGSQTVLEKQMRFETLERKAISFDLSELPSAGSYHLHMRCEDLQGPLTKTETYMGNYEFMYCSAHQCESKDGCLMTGTKTIDGTKVCTDNGLLDVADEDQACVQGQCSGKLRCTDGTCSLSFWDKILRLFGL